jgi:hypothetical protein
VTSSLEFTLQLAIIVNFSIEDDCDGVMTSGHWLMATGKIDDRESPHS